MSSDSVTIPRKDLDEIAEGLRELFNLIREVKK
jgi:hypothetical protein